MYIDEQESYCFYCAPDTAEYYPNEEVDTPVHCAECEELLDYRLTQDGIKYVLEALDAYNKYGHGRHEILWYWALNLYDYGLDESDRDVIREFFE